MNIVAPFKRRLVTARGGVALAGLLLLAASVAACGGTTTTAEVRNCLRSSVVSFDQPEGAPRAYQDLELEVSCRPSHPFELSEVTTSGDFPVLTVQYRGADTCLHREFKAKGEKCSVELAFEPRNPPGEYFSYVIYHYARENESFETMVTGNIKHA